MSIPPNISHRIERAIGMLEPEPLGHVNYEGRRHRALPLFGTVGEVWLLRPDGTLWRADSDAGLPLEPLPAELHTMALVAGSLRYPWLGALLPVRPLGAIECGTCDGAGRLGATKTVFCNTCGALGWRPPPPG